MDSSAKNKLAISLVALVDELFTWEEGWRQYMLATNLRVIYRMPQVPFPWIDFAGWETRRGWFALASKGSLKGECRFQASPQCAWADNMMALLLQEHP